MQSGGSVWQARGSCKKMLNKMKDTRVTYNLLSIFLVKSDGEVNKNKRAHLMTLTEIGMHLKLSVSLEIS